MRLNVPNETLTPSWSQSAPAPAAPAPPKQQTADSGGGGGTYKTPIPGAALYGQAALAAKTAYQKALARLNSKRQSTLQQYGYTAQIDPKTGTLTHMRVDPNNPYGYYEQLLNAGAENAQAAENTALDRGLSATEGLGAQLQTKAHHQFGQDSAALGTSLTQTLQGFQDQQDEAVYQRNQTLYQAELEAARMAIEGGDFNPGNVADSGSNSGGGDSGAGSDGGDSGGSSSGGGSSSPSRGAVVPGIGLVSHPAGIDRGGSSGGSVKWGGQTFSRRNALARWLAAHGSSYATWAANHPSAAAKLR